MMDVTMIRDLVIKLHDTARQLTDQQAAAKIRTLGDLAAEVANELQTRWVSTSGSAPSS